LKIYHLATLAGAAFNCPLIHSDPFHFNTYIFEWTLTGLFTIISLSAATFSNSSPFEPGRRTSLSAGQCESVLKHSALLDKHF
jgi:hypothetical protein